MKLHLLAPLAVLLMAAPLRAQQPAAPQLVDRILAVVGDSIIFEGEVKEQVDQVLEIMRARGDSVPTDSAGLAKIRRDILSELIDRLVLVQAALRDSALVAQIDEGALNIEVEKDINERRQRMGGSAQFEAALREQRLTLNEFHDMMLADLRKQTLNQRYLQRIAASRKPPPISEKELKEEFEREKALMPQRPPTVTFDQVAIVPTASDSSRAVARAKADSLLGELQRGADFAALAKQYSDDAGSRETGGDLGWSRPSQWVKEFADAVYRLRPGETSPIVETSHGYHIIKLEKVRSAERQARHILITPAPSEDDNERALARGRELADQIRAGANVDSLQRAVGNGEASRIGPAERARITELGAEYAQELANVKNGDVIGPFVVTSANGRKVVVLKVVDVREVGAWTIDDPALNYRRKIEQKRLIAEIIEDLRRQTHIDIRQ